MVNAPNTLVASWISENPVMKVAADGLRPTSPVMVEGETVEIPVLARVTKPAADKRLTATGLVARV